MRYTTIIDITASRELYGNINVRLVYLHLCLKAGYHDNDRDMIRTSIRTLAADVGITTSAVRHAIRMLEKYGLLKRQPQWWAVRKWVPTEEPTKRATTKREMAERIAAMERERAQAALDADAAQRKAAAANDVTQLGSFKAIQERMKKIK